MVAVFAFGVKFYVFKRLAALFNLLPDVTKLLIRHPRIPLDAYIHEQIFVKKGVFSIAETHLNIYWLQVLPLENYCEMSR